MRGCIDDSEILALVEGAISPEAREAMLEHSDGCPKCRALLVAASRESTTDHGTDPPTFAESDPGAPAVVRGASVGRYIVMELLGSGGMGEVHSAYDPALDRKVALKLLHEDGRARDRLEREGRALARFSHPNVVTVYDVGMTGNRLYVAMEYVAGRTLRAWVHERPRSWREVVAVFVAAGRGLEEAHAQGIIHRDFKPENVLVGADGRVRVADFGLARGLADQEEAPAGSVGASARPLTATLTTHQGVVGTPAYLAPEQVVSGAVPASDQFAFCVSLYEALCGVRPFAGDSLDAIMERVRRGELTPPPPDVRAPPWLMRVVVKGLAARPEDRHPSMSALLSELGRDPGRRWRRVALTAVGALFIGAVLVASRQAKDADPCSGAEAYLAGIWDEPVKQKARAAIGESPLGRSSWEVLAPRLDAWAERWTRARSEACMATRVEGTQSEAVLDLRTQCFDRALREVDQMTLVMTEPSPTLASDAVLMLGALPDLARCRADAVLASQVAPPDPAIAGRVAALTAEVDHGLALSHAGRHQEASTLAERLAPRAHELGYLPLEAQADLLLARAQDESRQVSPLKLAERAFREATSAGDAHLAAEALLLQLRVRTMGAQDKDLAEAAGLAREAASLMHRLGDERLAVRVEHMRGVVLFEQGDYASARAQLEQVVATCRRLDDVELLHEALLTLGRCHAFLLEVPTAIRLESEAVTLAERALGSEHPIVATYLHRVSGLLLIVGRRDEAEAMLARALRIRLQAYGPASPQVAEVKLMLSNLLSSIGRPLEALAILDQTIASDLRDDDLIAEAYFARALELGALERFAEAARDADECVRRFSTRLPADHLDLLWVRILAIRYAALAGEIEDALPRLRAEEQRFALFPPGTRSVLERELCVALLDLEQADALESCTQFYEADRQRPVSSMQTVWAELVLGRARLLAGDASGALELLDSAATAFADERGYSPGRVRARFALAQALVATGGSLARARGLAEDAYIEILRESGDTPLARQIGDWLVTQP